MRHSHRPLALLIISLLLVGCRSSEGTASPRNAAEPPAPVILSSIDGLRWDYLDLRATPSG